MPSSSNSFKKAFRHHQARVWKWRDDFLSRRPHRSFRLTRRRDTRRSLQLPGYFAFTGQVIRHLWSQRRVFFPLLVVYVLALFFFVGIGSQEVYATLLSTLQETGSEIAGGNPGQLIEAGVIFLSIASTGLTGELSEGQQIYSVILLLLIWLTTVWILRAQFAGKVVKLRDALYSAGSPIVATALIAIVLIIQLLPIAFAAIAYSAAETSGLLTGGVEAMLFWITAALLATLSLYWLSATFFALIIVTLPGMYPIKALRTAGDMVVSRRLRLLLRFVWMIVVVSLALAIILIPIIALDAWLKSVWPVIEWLPIVPVSLAIVSAAGVIFSASYIYMLYRKVVDDDALPA